MNYWALSYEHGTENPKFVEQIEFCLGLLKSDLDNKKRTVEGFKAYNRVCVLLSDYYNTKKGKANYTSRSRLLADRYFKLGAHTLLDDLAKTRSKYRGAIRHEII